MSGSKSSMLVAFSLWVGLSVYNKCYSLPLQLKGVVRRRGVGRQGGEVVWRGGRGGGEMARRGGGGGDGEVGGGGVL